MDFQKDYYKIFGVADTATKDEIKRAYYKLAIRYHPDRNPGKPEFEELTKQLNEAKEVLLNEQNRFAYDEYRRGPQGKRRHPSEEADKEPDKPATRTRKVFTEIRIYITGKIYIKYTAPEDADHFDPSLRESYYLIHPTTVSAVIERKDCIWSETHPDEFADIFEKYPLFPMSIPQPVSTLMIDGDIKTYYSLGILELRVPDPKIILVTKHENKSYGTISGQFYGYVKDFEEREVIEIIEQEEQQSTQFSGATGRTEDKFEEGKSFTRPEYFYSDGSTFFGKWQEKKTAQTQSSNKSSSNTGYTYRKKQPSPNGCFDSGAGIFMWVIIILWLIIKAPYILPLIIFYAFLVLLSQLFGNRNSITRFIGTGLFFILFIALMIRIFGTQHHRIRSKQTVSTQTERENKIPERSLTKDTGSSYQLPDTVLTRFREWSDYKGNEYSGYYTYRSSHLRASEKFKNNIGLLNATPANYDYVIHSLKEHDALYLPGVYRLFDSIRTAKKLSGTSFAEMIVSFVQDIPYSIVLDRACDASLYKDAFINHYLASPGAICEPYQRFGIYSPLEFIAHCNGDCDSRTLFSYLVLSHYGYDVALLSSEVFHHSIIGIDLPYSGAAYRLGNKRYVVWETTAPQTGPGIIDPEMSDMHRWRISLLNQP